MRSETSEGSGKDYSLPNHAHCESCAGSGELFFQHKLNRACQDARVADLYEETLYNAILGGVRAITGAFADGKPMLAIPNYARLNRGGRSIVWLRGHWQGRP